uniref:C2H2-type domain-containing protein n=1 Tax=Ditylenchus dipsaci TaxID=166011 RepID=A0A915CYX8_9BILA
MPDWVTSKLTSEINQINSLLAAASWGRIQPYNGVDFSRELPKIRGGGLIWTIIDQMQDKNCTLEQFAQRSLPYKAEPNPEEYCKNLDIGLSSASSANTCFSSVLLIASVLGKWKIANQKLPKSQRRPEPVEPEIIRVGGKIDYEATNNAAYEAAMAQLLKCENCGRTFAPERLRIHQKSCTKENPAAAVGDLKVRRDVPLATTNAAMKRSKSSDRVLAVTNKSTENRNLSLWRN